MARVVMIGAGLAGMATALFAARRGHQVSVLERDQDPPPAELDDCFSKWRRPGVGHAKHTHVFLTRSTQILEAEAPEVLDALFAAGAHAGTMRLPPGLPAPELRAVNCRRSTYETIVRRALEASSVDLRLGARVAGLLADGGEPPQVRGVRLESGEEIPADLVVDASGRRSYAPRWLEAIGSRPLSEERHDCGFFYQTRWYRLRPGESFPGGPLTIINGTSCGAVILSAAEDDLFSASLMLSNDDPLRHAFRDPALFDAVVGGLPALAPWISRGEGLTEPVPFGPIENRRRRLVSDGAPIVGGFALVGDAALHTNPTLGRGTSMGFMHAQGLAQRLEGGFGPDWVAGFDAWTADALHTWFDSQVQSDAATGARYRAMALGLPMPETTPAERMMPALFALAAEDPMVGAMVGCMQHVLITPAEVMSDAALVRRVAAKAAAMANAEAAPGLSRSQVEALVAA